MECIWIVRDLLKEKSATTHLQILLILNCSSISLTLDLAKIAFKLKKYIYQLISCVSMEHLVNKYLLHFIVYP